VAFDAFTKQSKAERVAGTIHWCCDFQNKFVVFDTVTRSCCYNSIAAETLKQRAAKM